MIFKAKTRIWNRKLFASFSGTMLICSFSLLLLIERNYTEKVLPKKKVSPEKISPEKVSPSASTKMVSPKSRSANSKECYQRLTATTLHNNDYGIEYLEDVMDRQPSTGENIFFHETTCSKSGLVHLNSRQACAIESAARLNPERHVYVLFASPVGFRYSRVAHLPKNIEVLKSYPNVHIRNNNLWRYVEDTPLETWLNDGSLFESKHLHEHVSDVLRYLTLYKFGGTYLDLDVVVQRNFDDLGKNFAGDDSDVAIGCGVLHFGTDQLGREMSEECLRFLLNHFNGEIFIDNGPLVLTRTLERLCETENRTLMTRKQCKGFQVFPRSVFYAVSWGRWKRFFDPSMTNKTLQLTKNSTVIHVWNDMSNNIIVRIGAHTAYEVAAKINCPRLYETRLNFEYF